jgi:yeast amino acid transporter
MSAPQYREEDVLKNESGMTDTKFDGVDGIGSGEPKQRDLKTRILHSFRRKEFVTPGLDAETGLPRAGDTSNLHRKLKSRHLQMISIGGAIGAGLFIGSGRALAKGGPGAVLLDFGLIGFMLFCTVNALGELATLFPVQGIFSNRDAIEFRFIFDILDPFHRSGLGFRYGMELRYSVADHSPLRTRRGWVNSPLLER